MFCRNRFLDRVANEVVFQVTGEGLVVIVLPLADFVKLILELLLTLVPITLSLGVFRPAVGLSLFKLLDVIGVNPLIRLELPFESSLLSEDLVAIVR